MADIQNVIETTLRATLEEDGRDVPAQFTADMVLLEESGLDSLGFAILVSKLEVELGYDPFVLMDTPVYPRTFSEFVATYEKFADHATG